MVSFCFGDLLLHCFLNTQEVKQRQIKHYWEQELLHALMTDKTQTISTEKLLQYNLSDTSFSQHTINITIELRNSYNVHVR